MKDLKQQWNEQKTNKILELIKKLEEVDQRRDTLMNNLDEIRSDKDLELKKIEVFKLCEEMLHESTIWGDIVDDLFKISYNNVLLQIPDKSSREKIKTAFEKIKQLKLGETSPYERYDGLGFLSSAEWGFGKILIQVKLDTRPWSDLLIELLEEISPWEFGDRRADLGTLVINDKVPEIYIDLFNDLKRSYTYGLYNPVGIYCRSIVEAGIKDSLSQDEVMKSTGLEDLIEMCFKNGLFTDSEKKDANKIRVTVNKILHRGATISKEEAYDYIKKTYRIIETLYT